MIINSIESGKRRTKFSFYSIRNVPYWFRNFSLWKSYGCNVYISRADTTKRSGCEELLMMANTFGQVSGIFNLAVVLSDHVIENQTSESFDECLAPKAYATRHLDELSRQMCPNLEHFVVFSSVACGLGNAGQTNYGMANGMMERIIEQRLRDKLPGKAIQWGAVGDVGIVAEMLAGNNHVQVLGTLPQRIDNCLDTMDELICGDAAVVLSMIVPHKEQAKALDLVGTVLNIIGIADVKSVSIHATLTELGVDSLMNNEIRQVLERDYDMHVSTADIRMLTIARLSEMSIEPGKQSIDLAAVESKEIFSPALIQYMGDESTKNLNIVKANAAAETADDTVPCVLVIPGIEGVASEALIKFCQRLQMPAFILQLHTTHRMNNANDVISQLAADIVELHKNRKRFCIAAYSFGTVLALEVARLLERESVRHGQIFLIDGNSYALHELTDKLYGCHRHSTMEKFGTKILEEFLHNFPKEQRSDAVINFAKAQTFDEKLDVCVELLGTTKYSREYLKEAITGCINRFAIIEHAQWEMNNDKINANITLVQATESFAAYGEESVSLQTNGKTEKHSIIANHSTILDQDAVIQLFL